MVGDIGRVRRAYRCECWEFRQKSNSLGRTCGLGDVSYNWLLDFGNDETPGEGVMEAKDESK